MKKLIPILFISFLLTNCKDKEPNIPKNRLQNVVVDSANLFSKGQIDSLSLKIISYEEKSTNEIGILTIDSLTKDMSIQRYGTNVANKWGIGKKEKDNGLLITISKYDRKVALSTGLGTEKTISDYECKVIINNLMVPQFKTENYYKGITKALDSIFILWD